MIDRRLGHSQFETNQNIFSAAESCTSHSFLSVDKINHSALKCIDEKAKGKICKIWYRRKNTINNALNLRILMFWAKVGCRVHFSGCGVTQSQVIRFYSPWLMLGADSTEWNQVGLLAAGVGLYRSMVGLGGEPLQLDRRFGRTAWKGGERNAGAARPSRRLGQVYPWLQVASYMHSAFYTNFWPDQTDYQEFWFQWTDTKSKYS